MAITRLTEELLNPSKQNSDGYLILNNNTSAWNLHFNCGQLLFAADRFHPIRRWYRALEQHRLKWHWNVEFSQLPDNQSWSHILTQGINQKQLSLLQAKLLIRSVFQECVFELSSYTDIKSDWKPSQKATLAFYRAVALSANEMQTVLNAAMQRQKQWQAAGLGHLSPTLAPTLKQGAYIQAYSVLDKYLNGKFTLWDIALHLEKSVTEVTCSLLPLIDKGILQFQKIPDLPMPTVKQLVVPTSPLSETKPTQFAQKQPLIACIDDSPVLAHTLKKILISAGYQMLSIPEPMRGFSQLIEYKPDLILLDLLLPNADGYSICKFLRDTPVFKEIPIIILTAKNTPIDQARARLVGATEFLGKPPQTQELLQMLKKHLVL